MAHKALFAASVPLPSPARRALLAAAMASGLGTANSATPADQVTALKARPLAFPRDFGSHPDARIEWWYITGYASAANEQLYGFQVTFFRAKVEGTETMRSALAAKHLLFAHAAVTDVTGKKLWHDQRIARSSGPESVTPATASEKDTSVQLRDWSLERQNGVYAASVVAKDFRLKLQFKETQPLILQGDKGLSRKGPLPQHASFYYSKPQLAVSGSIAAAGQSIVVEAKNPGVAWLDHEWSNEILPPGAVGWDWIGMNLFDGSALTVFRLRDKAGNTLWGGGSFRHPKMSPPEKPYVFSPGEVAFQAVRGWKSPFTQALYPVEWLVRTPADFYTVKALVDNQELDSSATTGAVYWEGLADLYDSNGKLVGRGYLEMTGYAKPLRFS